MNVSSAPTTSNIVGLGGSVASRSRSLISLKAAMKGAEAVGAQTTLFDLRAMALPLFSPELLNDPPDEAVRLSKAAYQANGLIWSSPMYHGTVSGAFKNALDWLYLLHDRDPPYLGDKVIGLISTAGGTQGLQAVNTMEFIVRSLRGWAVPLVVPVGPASNLFDEQGNLHDEAARRQLETLGSEVSRVAQLFITGKMGNPEEVCREAARKAAAA